MNGNSLGYQNMLPCNGKLSAKLSEGWYFSSIFLKDCKNHKNRNAVIKNGLWALLKNRIEKNRLPGSHVLHLCHLNWRESFGGVT